MAIAEVAHDWIGNRCRRCGVIRVSPSEIHGSCIVDVPKPTADEHEWVKSPNADGWIMCRWCGYQRARVAVPCVPRPPTPPAERVETAHDWRGDTLTGFMRCDRCGVVDDGEAGKCVVSVSKQPHTWGGSIGKTVLCLRCGASADVVSRNPLQVVTTDASIWCGGKTAQEEWGDFVGSDVHQKARQILAGGPPHDAVNHPSHYTSSPARCSKCAHPIECIDVVEHMTFSIGNCVKYLWRVGLKEGEDPITTLRKAAWYIAREIKRLETGGGK